MLKQAPNHNHRESKITFISFSILLMLIFSSASKENIGTGINRWMVFADRNGRSYSVGIAIFVTAMAGVALAATIVYSRKGSLKSPWSNKRRKHALQKKQWKSLFASDGKLVDGGVKFLKKVRSGGVDPSIRVEVWPFLLGVFPLNSSGEERDRIAAQNKREYKNLRKQCYQVLKSSSSYQWNSSSRIDSCGGGRSGDLGHAVGSPGSEDTSGSTGQLSGEVPDGHHSRSPSSEREDESGELSQEDVSSGESDAGSTISFSPEEPKQPISSSVSRREEDFATWQRIMRVDAVRANAEWLAHLPPRVAVSLAKAERLAEKIRLKDYDDDLDPCRILHAARLVAILEAYALYDPEIGYCQGMSDLLSPIIAVMEKDDEAFSCFVRFMNKARHNFRLDEAGIRRQLGIISKIIKCKDVHLYRHLEKLRVEDCSFVYRMLVVLLRRELDWEQTLCLWEVMWADQAAIRAGIAHSSWGRMRMRAPPNDDLLLYAIAACVLQRRKLIIERFSSMEEIMRECNNMAGHLDVWRLLDDAHHLVVSLHDKI